MISERSCCEMASQSSQMTKSRVIGLGCARLGDDDRLRVGVCVWLFHLLDETILEVGSVPWTVSRGRLSKGHRSAPKVGVMLPQPVYILEDIAHLGRHRASFPGGI